MNKDFVEAREQWEVNICLAAKYEQLGIHGVPHRFFIVVHVTLATTSHPLSETKHHALIISLHILACVELIHFSPEPKLFKGCYLRTRVFSTSNQPGKLQGRVYGECSPSISAVERKQHCFIGESKIDSCFTDACII